MSKDQRAAFTEKHERRIRSAVEAEQAWLGGRQGEPAWPPFPPQEPNIDRGIPLSQDAFPNPDRHSPRTSPPTEDVNHKGAALWLDSARGLFCHAARPWLCKMADAYASWTAGANGLGLNQYENVDTMVLAQWNESYSALVAYCITGMEPSELDQFALNRITSLPDRSFIGICEQFLLHVDKEYVAGDLVTQQAVHIRSTLIDRLIRSDEWHRWKGEWITINPLARLVARLFMHDGWSQPPRCWLRRDGVALVDPLLPALGRVAGAGPCVSVVIGMLEVDPRPSHLLFIVASTEAWLRLSPDNSELWVDDTIGRRVCRIVDSICRQRPILLSGNDDLRKRIDDVLASLTGLGVREASVLEQKLATVDA